MSRRSGTSTPNSELLRHEADVAVDGREGLARFDPLVHPPIVTISGSAEPHDERRAAQAGLRFLRKPVAFAQFKTALAAVVEPAEAAQ